MLTSVATRYPDMMFEVVNAPTDELVEGLDDGRFDLVVATDIARTSDYAWLKLYSEHAFLSMPQDCAVDAAGSRIRGESLAGLSFTLESNMLGYTDWYAYILRNADVPDESVRTLPFKEYLATKDTLSDANFVTSLIMRYVGTNDSRRVVALDEKYAHRNVGLLMKRDCADKASRLAGRIADDLDYILSGNAYTSYFLYPEDAGNLRIIGS